VEGACYPGGFLCAVLENNLRRAVDQADDVNLRALPAIVGYLFNRAPARCWGSREQMDHWDKCRGLAGLEGRTA